MSKASKAKRHANKLKGARRLAARSSRDEREFERLQRWLYHFPEIAELNGARLETVLLSLASRLIQEKDPRAAEAIQFLQRWAPGSPETLTAMALLHCENRAYGSAWVCLNALLDSAPKHAMAAVVQQSLADLESTLRENGFDPARLVLWDAARDLIHKNKLDRARRIVEQLVEGWPDDQDAAELLAALPSVA